MDKIPKFNLWYRNTCRRFFCSNFLPVVKSDRVVEILHCLLWLNDDKSWESFRMQICDSFPSENLFQIFATIASSEDIRKALLDSPSAFNTFITILTNFISKTNSSEELPFSWKQPKAVVHGHPEVEAFLRSNAERTSYKKYTSKKETQGFCTELKANGPLDGFSVKASIRSKNKNRKVYYCEITKTKDHSVQEMSAIKLKVKRLENLLESLSEQRDAASIPLAFGRLETDDSLLFQRVGDLHIVHKPTASKGIKLEMPITAVD